MPFTDPVSSISGRNSRASNVSGMTGTSRSVRSGPAPAGQPNDTLANAGVLSMLKTSTDTGDIGSLSFNTSRLPAVPRSAHQRRGHIARPSGSSHPYPGEGSSHHHYGTSQASRISDSTTYQRRGSLTSMQSMPPSLPPVNLNKGPLQMPPPTLGRGRESRSYSLTSAPASQPLPRQRSSTSLKSAGHQPRHGHRLHPGHPPPMPEVRPPYIYPTRLKRPGYRSPSPALSELSAQGPPMPQLPTHASSSHGAPPQAARRPQPAGSMPIPRPQLQAYNTDYGMESSYEHRHAYVRAPPRVMDSSPVAGYELGQHAYRPSPLPGMHMPPRPHPPVQPSLHAPHRGPYTMAPYQQRAGYIPHPHMQFSGYLQPAHRGPPQSASAAPMAASMFHNAARMARQLPQRSDTPMTDSSPPSSDPPSSGTAPTSSSPPTPKDQTTLQVAVDPLFIDPALTDLPDSSSEPVLSAKYFEFADGVEKPIDETDVEVPHPSVPPTGFVQRVRAMLESKAAIEAAAKRELECEKAAQPKEIVVDYRMDGAAIELHELAADGTPRCTIIEEFEAPVELPASPVRLAELTDSPARMQQHRITRELVKAELAGSSTNQDTTFQAQSEEPNDIDTGSFKMNIHLNDATTSIEDRDKAHEHPSPPNRVHGTPDHMHRKASNAASAKTASPEATGISGMDYALRFSIPVETTTTSEETQSKNPFVLDADTITLQHQYSKEKAKPSESPAISADRRKVGKPGSEVKLLTSPPVSPLLPGENVTRHSAVSPLQTQTHGIDDTLRRASETKDIVVTDINEQSQLGSTSQESPLPPTPRTPKTYSKSVQLPRNSVTTTDTPTSNRFSLPPDLSTAGETTVSTTSDMMTDVAVRFSMPSTTVIIGKPQIITIPPSSSPEKQDSPPKVTWQALQPRSGRRNSVTFADQIAPLNIKKADSRQEAMPRSEPAAPKTKSIIRRPSPLDNIAESSTASRESTTDLHFQGGNSMNGRFSSTHLPGLKEESVEDMSINEPKRVSDVTGGQQFPLPARIAAVKAMQERRLHESAEKAKARRTARRHNRSLAETRALPSLNFSRMDLIDKLNEALEVRTTKSLEVVRRRDFTGIYCPSPQRPQSTEPLRERYTSFFCKPEDFSIFDESVDEDENDSTPAIHDVPILEVQESTKTDAEEADQEFASRPLSPEDFLLVATQVNRLSIPSVTGLSERLSGLLPCLRNLQLDSILASDADIAHTIEDIHQLGQGPRPDTVLSGRTSAGIRTLAERAEEIVRNGTHDSVVAVGRMLMTNKELPPLPESASADKVSAVTSTDGKQSYLSGSVSAPSDLGKQLARPPLALVREKSPTTEEEVRQLLPPEMNPITRGAKRSMILSGASSRPWNQDENYPWASKNVDIDLSISSEAHTRDSVAGEVQRPPKSMDGTSFGGPTETLKGIDIGSISTNLDRSSSVTTEQATGVNTHHLRKQSKRSIIGSISRKIGLSGKCVVDDAAHTVPSQLVNISEDSQPHKPGDRYPTTGLTPPAAFNLDEVRSFFSDNSSENKRNTSFRKRLTGFKSKGKSVRLDGTRRHSLEGSTTYDAGSINAHREGAISSAHTYDGIGMGKAEFRIKRFGEKLRHLLAKGGELIRSLSTRSKAQRPERVREDWLSDSLYSGV